jgi:hypothetical protein
LCREKKTEMCQSSKNVWGSLLFVWSFDSRRRPNWRGSTIKREETSWGFFNKQLSFVFMFKSRVEWRSPFPSNRWASLKGSINTRRVDQSKTTAETGRIRSVRGEVGDARDNGHKIDSNISPPLYQFLLLYHLTTHTHTKIRCTFWIRSWLMLTILSSDNLCNVPGDHYRTCREFYDSNICPWMV